MTSLTHDDYTIAWICALPLEAAAARSMLEKPHVPLPVRSTDSSVYQLGELHGHYIVIVCLPTGVYGTVSAAVVLSHMRSTFPRLQYGLMVGIGGGVPGKNHDIRLGDVVVSKPAETHGGVIQYDYGKAVQSGQFKLIGALNKPPQTLSTHMSQLEAQMMTHGNDTLYDIVWETLEQNPRMQERFSSPGPHADLLFHSSYHHVTGEDTCEKCDKEQLVKREPRDTMTPYVHYGMIASGDQVIKDSETRDHLAQRHGILCFEMEAAGLMDELPMLVIRGICDYCDSHKQNQWQGYAALTAAAYTKELLSYIRPVRVEKRTGDIYILQDIQKGIQDIQNVISATGFSFENNPLARNRSRATQAKRSQSRPNPLSISESFSNPPAISLNSPRKSTLSDIWEFLFCFIFHQTTLIVILLLFVLLSGMMIVIAVQQTRQPACGTGLDTLGTDDGFWALLSQLLLQVLSIYCTIYPVVLDNERKILVAKFWFASLLSVSLITAVAAPITYAWSWKIATVLSFVSSFAQVISTGQLVASLRSDDGKRPFYRTRTSKIEDSREQ